MLKSSLLLKRIQNLENTQAALEKYCRAMEDYILIMDKSLTDRMYDNRPLRLSFFLKVLCERLGIGESEINHMWNTATAKTRKHQECVELDYLWNQKGK
jgi:hypothetical protein